MQIENWLDKQVRIKDSGTVAIFTVVEVYSTHTGYGIRAKLRDNEGRIGQRPVDIDRLELVPPAELRTPAAKAGYLTIGDIRANSDEALEWLAFIMLQGAALFQNVPAPKITDDGRYVATEDPSRAELLRILTVRGETENGPVVKAALAYYDAATAWYEQDGKKYASD